MSDHVGIYRIEFIPQSTGRPKVEMVDLTQYTVIDDMDPNWDGKSQNYSGCWVRWEDYEKLRKQVNSDE